MRLGCMKPPWHNRTGHSKAIGVFAVITTISLGLCGANLALFSRYGYISAPMTPPDQQDSPWF